MRLRRLHAILDAVLIAGHTRRERALWAVERGEHEEGAGEERLRKTS